MCVCVCVYVHRCWWPVEELCSYLEMWVGAKLTSAAPVVAQQNETREAATREGTLCIGAVLLTIIHHHHTLINVCRECGATHHKTNATSDTEYDTIIHTEGVHDRRNRRSVPSSLNKWLQLADDINFQYQVMWCTTCVVRQQQALIGLRICS